MVNFWGGDNQKMLKEKHLAFLFLLHATSQSFIQRLTQMGNLLVTDASDLLGLSLQCSPQCQE